jgi:hypothetical protein
MGLKGEIGDREINRRFIAIVHLTDKGVLETSKCELQHAFLFAHAVFSDRKCLPLCF